LAKFSTVSNSWSSVGTNTAKSANNNSGYWLCLCNVGSDFYSIEQDSGQLAKFNGTSWSAVGTNTAKSANNNNSGYWSCLCAVGSNVYGIDKISGQLMKFSISGAVNFTNLKSGSTTSYTITGRRDIYIEPSSINDNNTITFRMQNIRIISAEITNRPYTKSGNTITFTPPVAADNKTKNKVLLDGGWQRAEDASPTLPTEAVKNVTAEACAKLKSDYRTDNVRIYIVKYQKQNGNYDYLNQCADFIYDAATPEALNTALQVIAADIKSFAGYEAAKNVQ
jgi:hypothetical protein